MSFLSAIKFLAILALVSYTVSKTVKLNQFQVTVGDNQIDLTSDEITFGFEGTSKENFVFTYSRKAHVKAEIEECKALLLSLQEYFPNATFNNNTLSFSVTAAEFVGSKMIRRGEFGDVYVFLIKNDRITVDGATMGVMTAKNEPNADELYRDITSFVPPPKKNLS